MLAIDEKLSSKLKFLTFVSTVFVLFLHSGGREAFQHSPVGVCSVLDDVAFNGIFSCAVPVFFLISGLLFSKSIDLNCRGYAQSLWKRVRTLGIPYVVWNLFHAGFMCLTANWTFPNPLAMFGLNQYFPHHFALWYVKFLFVFFLLSPCLLLVIRAFTKWFALELIGGVGVMALLSVNHSGTLVGFVFYAIGFWLGFRYKRIVKFLACHYREAVTVSLAITLGLLGARLTHSFLYGHDSGFLKYQTMAASTVLVWLLADLEDGAMAKKEWFGRLVSYSFFVYCFHFVVTCLTRDYVWKSFHPSIAPFVVAALAGVVSLSVGWILCRYCAPIYRILSGGR